MKVLVEKVGADQPEQVLIQCYEITGEVQSIVDFIKASGTTLAGQIGERLKQISVSDIFYAEAVDNRVFAYCESQVFELKCRLYEFEKQYQAQLFFRCSKSMVVNLKKIDYVFPILNGRLSAKLFNGEEITISRQYVSALKELLSGGSI